MGIPAHGVEPMKLLTLLLAALSLQGAVTVKYVRTTGGTHAGTLAGLQSAVDECAAANQTDPCIVDVEAGVTYSNGTACYLTLPAQTNATKLIVIRSSRIGELPDGDQVAPADTAKLFKVSSICVETGTEPDTSPAAIIAPPGAGVSHYVLQGCEAYTGAAGHTASGAISIGMDANNTKARNYAELPHSIVIDRCYAHGLDAATWATASSNHALYNGVVLNGRNITLKNSYIGDANRHAGESHGIGVTNGTGIHVHNTHIATGSITSLMGGDWVWITGMMLDYSTWYGNEYEREAAQTHWLEWDTTDTLNTSQACREGAFWEQKVSPTNKWKCVSGTWTSSSESRPNRGWTKNAWECKNCRMAMVEGNYIHDIPSTGDQSQYGFAFLINNRDYEQSACHARPENIFIRFNRVVRAAAGPTMSGGPGACIVKQTHTVEIEHNLFEAMGGPTSTPEQGTGLTTGGGTMLSVSEMSRHLRFRNNTVLYGRGFGGTGFALADEAPMVKNIDIRDNILPFNSVAQTKLNSIGEPCANAWSVMFGARYWNNEGRIDSNSRGESAFNTLYGGSNCPGTSEYAASESAAGFVNAASADYRLCTALDTPHTDCTGASPFAAASSTSGPLGADAAQVRVLTDDAAAGTFDPGKYAVRIKRVSSSEIAYVAREPQGVCTVTVTRGGSTVFTGSDGASLGPMERTVDPELDTNGEHIVRVSCLNAAATSAVWRETRWVRAE